MIKNRVSKKNVTKNNMVKNLSIVLNIKKINTWLLTNIIEIILIYFFMVLITAKKKCDKK